MKQLPLFRIVLLLAGVLLAPWEVASGQEKAVLYGHTSLVSSMSFSPDGSTLTSASWDEMVVLWDMTPYVPASPVPTAGGTFR